MSAPRVIDGRYTLRNVRGRGGMGTVWEAFDEVLQRRVAVKEVTVGPGDPRARERVLREARIAARLKHPRLVGVYDVVEEGDRVCLVQEFVDAPNLSEVVVSDGPLTPQRAAVVGRELLDGLEAMHREGVIHRDLKPSNVLLDGDRPRLTDYGIARVADDPRLTSTGLVMGSPAYLSPEQALGDETGPETDLWSLGATLFFAVEGRPPYEGQGGMATAMQVVNQPAPTPLSAGALTSVISGLMQRDPAARIRGPQLRDMLSEAVEATSAAPTAVLAPATPPLPPRYERVDERKAAAAPRATANSALPWLIAAIVGIILVIAGIAALASAGEEDGGEVADAPDTTAPTETSAPTTTVRPTTTTEKDEDKDDDRRRPRGVPDDWVAHEVADPGYTVFVPPNWDVRPLGDNRTDFVDPDTGTYLRVDWTDEPGDSPEEAWRRQSKSFAADKENYEEVSIESTEYKGYDAALWEYTYREGGTDLHAYNLGFVTGDYGFALNFQAPESRWEADEGMFDQLKAGFEVPSGDDDDDDD